jgi:hypothetical protein
MALNADSRTFALQESDIVPGINSSYILTKKKMHLQGSPANENPVRSKPEVDLLREFP